MSEMTDEEMFFIAADLTLYSNPLNRALGEASIRKAPPSPAPAATTTDAKADKGSADPPQREKTPELQPGPDEMIASDMNKYDSPLADLDFRYNQKHEVHQKAQEDHLHEEGLASINERSSHTPGLLHPTPDNSETNQINASINSETNQINTSTNSETNQINASTNSETNQINASTN